MSQILLNDASERGQKIKVVATLRNGLSAKEFANFIASERHEKVILYDNNSKELKFIYFEKVTKFCEISTNYLSYLLHEFR